MNRDAFNKLADATEAANQLPSDLRFLCLKKLALEISLHELQAQKLRLEKIQRMAVFYKLNTALEKQNPHWN